MEIEIKYKEFGETIGKVVEGDLDAHMSMGVVLNLPLGSLVTIRDYLETTLGAAVKFKRICSYKLYVVDWYGLSNDQRERFKK